MNEKEFVQGAFQALVDRGVISNSDFIESKVTDMDIQQFEEKYGVAMPSLFKTYLKTYCYTFDTINAPIPDDRDSIMEEDEEPWTELQWITLFALPQEEPLKMLDEYMNGFRKLLKMVELDVYNKDYLLPIGDWGAGWGYLFIDLSRSDDDVEIDVTDTWNIVWIDHGELDEDYLGDDGKIHAYEVAPDFKTLLQWYFYGIYDKCYEEQCESEEEELPDYSTYIDWED